MSILFMIFCFAVSVGTGAKTLQDTQECTETLPFSHPTDCAKFKICTPWGPQVMDCAPGTQFSSEFRVCVDSENSGCVISPTTSSPTTPSSTNSSSTSSSSTNSSSTNSSSTNSSPTTPLSTDSSSVDTSSTPECTETLPFPYPTDCAKFQVCTPWGAQVMDCAPGTQFSPEIRVCVYPDDSGCVISSTTSSPTNSSSTTASSTSSSSTNSSPTTPLSTDSSSVDTSSTPECTETLPFAYPTDCAKFQVCTPWGAQVMDCAPGTQFSPENRVCVYPDDSGCVISSTTSSPTNSSSTTASSTSSSSTNSSPTTPLSTDSSSVYTSSTPECTETLPFPHPTDCAKFQVCAPWGAQVMDCAPGTQFSPEIRVCVYPDDSGCVISSTTSSPTNSSSTTASSTSSSSTNSSPTSPLSTDSSSVDTSSTPECTETLPFPHPTDCAKFQVCAPWGAQVMDCAPGTQFSPEIRVCVHPDDSGCVISSTTSSPTNSSSTTASSTSSSSTNSSPTTPLSTDSSSVDTSSTPECTETLPFPHPTDCAKFQVCAPWGAQVMDCAPGTQFSPEIRVCVHPDDSGCVISSTTSSPTNSSLTTASSTSSSSTNSSPTTPLSTDSSSVDTSSTPECTETLPFPHPTDCAKFQVCAPWGAQVMDCAPGTQFSPEIRVCVHPDDSGCVISSTTSSPTNSSSTTASSTSSSSTNSSPTTPLSTDSSSVDTSSTPECTETLPFPHPTDCAKFQVCAPWGAQVMDCAPGTQFSPEIRVCVHPDDSGCVISSTTSSPTNSSSTTASSTSSSSTNSSPTSPLSTDSSSVDTSSTPECTETLPFPHPTDCAKFQVCAPWGPQVMDCAPGTQFSPEIRVCVHPANLGCAISSTTSSPTNPSSTSSSLTTTPKCTETLPFPHPTDCSKFQVCTPSGAQIMDCPPQTHFSPQYYVCVRSEYVECSTVTRDTVEETTNTVTTANEIDDESAETLEDLVEPTESNTDESLEDTTNVTEKSETTHISESTSSETKIPSTSTNAPIEASTISTSGELNQTQTEVIIEESSTEALTVVPTAVPTVNTSQNIAETSTELATEIPTKISTEALTEVQTVVPTVTTSQNIAETSTELATEIPTKISTEALTEVQTVVSTVTTSQNIAETSTELATKVPITISTEALTEVPTVVPTVTTSQNIAETSTELATKVPITISTEALTEFPTVVPTVTTSQNIVETSTELATEIPTEISTEAPKETYTEALTEIPNAISSEASEEVPADTESSTQAGTETTPVPPPVTESPEIICQNASGNDDLFFPHPTDCNKFFGCFHGIIVTVSCLRDKPYFSPQSLVCVEDSSVCRV